MCVDFFWRYFCISITVLLHMPTWAMHNVAHIVINSWWKPLGALVQQTCTIMHTVCREMIISCRVILWRMQFIIKTKSIFVFLKADLSTTGSTRTGTSISADNTLQPDRMHKIGHRRVNEDGQVTYKKVTVMKLTFSKAGVNKLQHSSAVSQLKQPFKCCLLYQQNPLFLSLTLLY